MIWKNFLNVIKLILLFFTFSLALANAEWAYFSDSDFGMRNDRYGRGDFAAARGGWTRKHTGIDYLLDYELKIYSPCDGQAKWVKADAFGYSIDVVCSSPFENGSLRNYFFSIRFSHLHKDSLFIQVAKQKMFYEIKKSELLGLVGDSGNAKGTKPHVHLEMSVHKKLKEALDASHPLQNQEEEQDSRKFIKKLKKVCEFANKQDRVLNLDERIDPYVVFRCLDLVPDLDKHLLQEDELYPGFYNWVKHYKE